MIAEARFASNAERVAHRSEVDTIVSDWFAQRTRAGAMEVMGTAGVTAAPHAPVPRLSDTLASLRTPAPDLGAHTNAVLASIRYDAAAIDALIKTGVVA